ncbi:helix-turn-helix domain-containing protein [Sansalvadorimonas verongulae]|uniref:helix-turn-helix domain-containing protein n=1 Tax=Sansalvadorimonas verongulae TaxID=2172824 RepID=UPI0012BBDF6D|nr:helix-turn-helix domain-containing protein [Sansalvadorimonas verongulae]MTI12366.1 hypothetical protein [Sansalvadorimonas verongulae]
MSTDDKIQQTLQRREQVAELHAEGFTIREMAALLVCGETTIRNDINKLGLTIPNYSAVMKQRAVELRQQGKTIDEIAKLIGRHRSTVVSYLGPSKRNETQSSKSEVVILEPEKSHPFGLANRFLMGMAV